MRPISVLVIGGGPAGLSAAARLLEEGHGSVRVHVLHMQDVLGGKAATWRDESGFLVEHGWHMMVGFYENLFALMKRAGIEKERAVATLHGDSHCFEPSSGRIHTMNSDGGKLAVAARFLGYDGLPLEDRLNFGRFMTQAFSVATSGERLTHHDDICFDTWAVEHGLRRHVTRYSMFRFLRLAYFNFPEQISAYHVLQTLKHMSTSEEAELFTARRGTTEAVWSPIGAYLARMGATFEARAVVTDWLYEGDRITGVRAADALATGPLADRSAFEGSAFPIAQGTERTVSGFDYVVSTLPVAMITRMNKSDARMWGSPFFKRMTNIRSAVTMSLTIVTKKPLPAVFRGPVHGFPSPFNFVVNMKPYWDEHASDPNVGAVLVFGGQEAGFEAWSDEEVLAFTLESYAKSEAFGDLRALGITKIEMHRNRELWERLFISEPGMQQFRPGPETPFRNLFLAGDWVRNKVDLIAMEGAVASGIEAADHVLARASEA